MRRERHARTYWLALPLDGEAERNLDEEDPADHGRRKPGHNQSTDKATGARLCQLTAGAESYRLTIGDALYNGAVDAAGVQTA